MPISHELNTDLQLLETRAQGLVTADDIERHLDLEERDGVVGIDQLFDARDATTDVTTIQVRRLVRRTDEMARRGRFGAIAIVTDDKVAFGMARMYQMLCDEKTRRVGVFRDLNSARRWLASGGAAT